MTFDSVADRGSLMRSLEVQPSQYDKGKSIKSVTDVLASLPSTRDASSDKVDTPKNVWVELAVSREGPTNLDSTSQQEQHDVFLNCMSSAQMQNILLKARK